MRLAPKGKPAIHKCSQNVNPSTSRIMNILHNVLNVTRCLHAWPSGEADAWGGHGAAGAGIYRMSPKQL